jgi:hypothetical protein
MLDQVADTLGPRVSAYSFLLEPMIGALAALLDETSDTDPPAAYRMAAPSLTDTEAIAERPLFFLVSDLSSVRPARVLGTNRACYLLPHVRAGRPVLQSIETTATSCLWTPRSLAPRGPHHARRKGGESACR